MPNTFKAKIDKLRSAYEAAVAAGDASAMSPLLEEGAVFVRPGAPEWEAMAAAAPGLPFPPGAKIAIRGGHARLRSTGTRRVIKRCGFCAGKIRSGSMFSSGAAPT